MNSVMRAWADLPPIPADRLMALLTEPRRLTRGLHHVNALLLQADRHCHPHWLRPLRWAALYHRAIDDPRASPEANRAGSAELWLEHFSAIHDTVRGVSATWEQDVATAIVVDPLRRPPVLLPWQQAFLDLCLGDWAASPLVYEACRLLERAEAEVAGISEERWTGARVARLDAALTCGRLFHSVHADKEILAKDNIRRERSRYGAAG